MGMGMRMKMERTTRERDANKKQKSEMKILWNANILKIIMEEASAANILDLVW